jgi:hypothetical protein
MLWQIWGEVSVRVRHLKTRVFVSSARGPQRGGPSPAVDMIATKNRGPQTRGPRYL